MHTKPEVDLLPLDTEIERTLKNLRKAINAEYKSMANQKERLQTITKEEKKRDLKSLILWRNFWRPIIQKECSAMRQPLIEANNLS